MPIEEELVAAFLKGNGHNIALLRAIDVESLLLRPRPRARTIGKVFAHLHEVRLRWLEAGGGARELAEIEPLAGGEEESRDALEAALGESAAAVARFLRGAIAAGGRVKGFRGTIPDFVAYLVAHDAHHRGQVLALLAREKKRIPEKVAFGLWEWG
jgi:uncharacterized damage-inducible protein DinB